MMADDRVLAHLHANHDRIFSKLVEFASIPSVSTDPAHAADIERAARWVAAEVTAAGPFTVRTVSTAGNPVV
jgi:acetylornithine deacetylase/succinyl-diaminopimelate desuccinylase-like protein